ncbi:type IV secretion protein Rhs [Bacillus cereus]|nr:type IV secretion protein Rhs [Bacillus thuringiensis]MEB8931478.1 type IV secretion protein Rhs [Bacillus cereus]MEB9914235.1 type IV secretion protein Rhs [Bacillus cereus]MEC3209110.1 type IV secretion protein Rhs [Bacillus cereus]MEC3241645.1 type IV secretion protein Rhs [Bacillus cereus]
MESTLAKGADSVSPFVKGVEIMPDGSVARTGMNYSGKFQGAHDTSKASIQSRISNLESGGVKGTGNIGKGASGANEFDDILIDSYKNLRKNKEISGQAHHLNQDAAFRDYIPRNDGLSVKLEGNIFKDIDSPHYNAHKSLEDFWNIYRKNGDLAGLKPNLTDYNNALRDSLINVGLSEAQVNKAVSEAIKQQINAGLLADDFVPRIPGRINLPKPKP